MKTDKEKIEETIQHFFDAYTNCNSEGLLKAFDKTTLLHHYYPEKGDLTTYDINEYAKILDNNKKNEKFVLMVKNGKKKIIYIDITEDAASAKVEILLENVKFTDYYNLVKTGDDWVIVNKIWNAFRLK